MAIQGLELGKEDRTPEEWWRLKEASYIAIPQASDVLNV